MTPMPDLDAAVAAARVAADDEALTRLGRSLGDLGSEHVARAAVEAAAPLIEAAVRAQIAEAIDALHTKLTEQWVDRVVDCDPEALHTLAGIDLARRWIVRGEV